MCMCSIQNTHTPTTGGLDRRPPRADRGHPSGSALRAILRLHAHAGTCMRGAIVSVVSASACCVCGGGVGGWVRTYVWHSIRSAHTQPFISFSPPSRKQTPAHTKQEALTHAIRRAELPYEGESSYYRWLAREFRRKRDMLASALREAGIEPMESQVWCGVGLVGICTYTHIQPSTHTYDGRSYVVSNGQSNPKPNPKTHPIHTHTLLLPITTGGVLPPGGRVGRLGARRVPSRR